MKKHKAQKEREEAEFQYSGSRAFLEGGEGAVIGSYAYLAWGGVIGIYISCYLWLMFRNVYLQLSMVNVY